MFLAFVIAAYAITWTCFIAVARTGLDARTAPAQALIVLGAFAPALSAVGLTAFQRGTAGIRDLFGQAFRPGAPAWTYLAAAVFMIVVKLAAALGVRVVSGAWPHFGAEPLALLPFAVALSMPVQIGEELGWRGFALPWLANRLGLARASLALGAIWACWHLPQFYILGADTFHQSFVVWAPQVVAMSVVFAWLWARAGARLLPVMLLHAAINNTKDIVPSASAAPPGVFSLHASPTMWATLVVLWVAAGVMLIFGMPKRVFQDSCT